MKMNPREIWSRFGTLIILLALIAIVSALSPQYFFTTSNLVQVILQSSLTIIVGLVELMAILTSGIDLSVGSIVAVSGLAVAWLLVNGWPIWLAVLGGLAVGLAIGLLNGFVIAKTNLPPFIVTLGAMSVFRGVALITSDGRPIFGLPSKFTVGIAGWWGPVPIPVIIALGLAAVVHFVLTYTRFGRNVYALGGNRKAAWLSGVNIERNLTWAYGVAGLLAGVAGVILTARLASAEPLAGVGWELNGIAATVIGGTSFFGGEGSVFGTVMGALIMGVIVNALNLLNIQSYYQQVVTGLVIILAVLVNQHFRK
ncbi:MAG TPA: allose ABC transporter [Firmicutes bacterium]|nr:allose ABC transporter [Bacillota bacterium]